jgi:hypothetical protein
MTTPDFEIHAKLRARNLTSHVPPDCDTDTEEVVLERHHERKSLPAQMQPGGQYDHVMVSKRVIARIATSHATETKPSRASGKRIRKQ